MLQSTLPAALLAGLALVAAGCRATGSPHEAPPRILENASGRELELDELTAELARADVVFLGELHDNDQAHRLQLAVFKGLLARRERVILSLEMLEGDVQPLLDDWLAGRIDEATFAAGARLWPNWREHYRPLALLAKERGVPVLAANVPRPLAAQVAREGLQAVAWRRHAPRGIDPGPGEYRRRFEAVMGSGRADMDRFFAAQCIKDDAMAESIADAIGRSGRPTPLVVHLCGRFHSDFGLGTVERLVRRARDLRIMIVTTLPRTELGSMAEEDLRRIADFSFLVSPSAQRK